MTIRMYACVCMYIHIYVLGRRHKSMYVFMFM